MRTERVGHPQRAHLWVAALVVVLPSAIGGTGTPPQGLPTVVHSQWRAPVEPAVVWRAFDQPPAEWLAGHRGVDFEVPPGTEVRSAAPGTVSFAGRVSDRSVVVVDHGQLRTSYEPVTPAVRVGQPVARGETLGRRDTGGHCADRCLHWGARTADHYLDPMLLVTGYRPVLKTPWA
jgi:murein DD-endopeptidase MepM/ murein hydrolase activator NlpD